MPFSRLQALHELQGRLEYSSKIEKLRKEDFNFVVQFIKDHGNLDYVAFNGEVRALLNLMVHSINSVSDTANYSRAMIIDDILIAVNCLAEIMDTRMEQREG